MKLWGMLAMEVECHIRRAFDNFGVEKWNAK
jgi:hypothetical protein